jgi:hypothetical protein
VKGLQWGIGGLAMLSERHSRPQQPFYGVVGRKAAELRIGSDWHEEDFIVSDVDEADQVDFWDPLSTQRQPKERNTHQSVYIFRDENIDNEPSFDSSYFVSPEKTNDIDDRSTEDWVLSAKLPEFSIYATQNPYVFEYSQITRIDLAERRAGWLVDILEIINSRRRAAMKERFKEVFTAHPHAATFRALSDLVDLGATADELLIANDLRELWALTPIWWSIRIRGRLTCPDEGAGMLSWRKAWRFASESGEAVAEEIIDSDWFQDWLNLRIGDRCYWRFVDYVEGRVSLFDHGSLLGPQADIRTQWEIEMAGPDISEIVDNHSRTGTLIRGYTDSWVSTEGGRKRNDILTPTKTLS